MRWRQEREDRTRGSISGMEGRRNLDGGSHGGCSAFGRASPSRVRKAAGNKNPADVNATGDLMRERGPGGG